MERTREQFLEDRKSGIGGSDVAAVLGISKWKTAYDIWLDKTGRSTPKDETSYQRWGILLEPSIADEFTRVTGKQVQRRNNMYRHKQYSCLVANIDRYVVGEKAILECKTCNAFGLSDWGPSGTDQIPEYYMTQVQHYMYVTGYRHAYLAVLIGGNTFRWYSIPYNEELAELQAAECVKFWNDCVEADMPPQITIYDDLASIFPGNEGEIKVAEGEICGVIQMLQIAKRNASGLKKEIETMEKEVKLFCENADTVKDAEGNVLLTFKRNKDTFATVTDWERLARENLPPGTLTEDVIMEYTSETMVRTGSRILRLK